MRHSESLLWERCKLGKVLKVIVDLGQLRKTFYSEIKIKVLSDLKKLINYFDKGNDKIL